MGMVGGEEKKIRITLNQILSLTGRLDDSPEDDTSRERFSNFLKVKK